MKTENRKESRSSHLLVLVFVMLAAGITTAGYFYYENYERQYRSEMERQLSAVADLKEHELVQWRKERLGDANVFYKNIVFSGLSKRYFENQSDADAKKRLKAFMGQVQDAYSYSRICLHDAAGVERVSVPAVKTHAPLVCSLRSAKVLKSGTVEFQDFYRDENDKKAYLTIFIPVLDEYDTSRVLGVLAMRIDPEQSLYPIISRWLMPSRTAEILISRLEGNDILFLNELKYQKNTALSLRVSMENKELPSVRAALGQQGIVEGVDYRGVPVLADVRKVSDSPWFLVARMDLSEVYAPVRERLWMIFVIVGLLLVSAGAGAGFLQRQQRTRFYFEQYKAVEALRDSEERYRITMMSVGDGVITTDTEGRLELLNPVAEALTGWGQEEARSKPLEEVFRIMNEETRQIVDNPARKVMREGIVVGLANHSVLIAKDGSEHPIADSGAPIRNEKGEITGVVLVFRDQTEERTAQKALRESERKFRETIKYLDEGYYSCMMDGVVLEHNQAFNRILGFDFAKDLKGAKLPDFWQNPDERKVYLQELMARGSIMNYLINAKKFDGEKVVVMANAHLVKGEHDKPIRIEGTFTDFTEHKRMEEALASSEQFLSNVIEQSPVSLWISDSEGTLIKMNQACRELFGITDEEAVGKYNLLKDNLIESQGFMSLVGDVFEKGEIARFTIDYDVRRVEHIEVKGATHRILDVVLSPIKDIHGTLTNVLVQHKDITESKRAEEALQESEERFRIAAETSNDVVYEWDLQQSVKWFGKIDEMLGYDPGEFPRTLDGLGASVHPEDWVRVMAAVQAHLEGRATFAEEYRAIRKDGTFRWWSARGAVARMPDGKPIRWVGTVTDITERKLSEDTLRIKNQVFEDSIASQSVSNSTGIITHVNPAFMRLWGYTSKEQAIGNSVGSFFADQADAGPVLEALATHDAWEGEFRAKRTDGTTFISRGFATSLRDTRGELVGYQSTNLDVTKERQAEEALRNANENLEQRVLERTAELTRSKQILDETGRLARVGGWELDLKKNALSFSDVTKQIHEVDPEYQPTLEVAIKFYAPEAVPVISEAVRRAIEDGESYDVELQLITAKQNRIWVRAIGQAYKENGEIVRIGGVFQDINVRKLAEIESRKKSEQLQLLSNELEIIIDSIPGLVFYKDTNNRFIRVNKYISDAYKMSKKQLEGIHLNDLHSEEQAQAYYEADLQVIRSRQPKINIDEPWETETGIRWVSTSKIPHMDEKGEVVGVIGVSMDVTERKKLEVSLRDQAVKTEALNKELEAFTYSVSHDLRAPLRHVSGYVNLLAERFQSALTEKGQHYLNSIADSVRQMGALIDNLLQYSRTGRAEMRRTELEMNAIVQETVESVQNDNPDRKIKWVVGKLPSVYGDDTTLRLVWMNLLSNAVKFTRTREKALIEIGAKAETKEVTYFVRDNGVGFDMQYAQKLFGVFQRLHSTEEFEGTGIGLANVHRIVVRHGGRTWAEAELDKGATFYFSIPKQ